MSSSRVIKSDGLTSHSVRDFRFETFQDRMNTPDDLPGDNGFVPFWGLKGMENPSLDDSAACGDTPGDVAQEDAQVVIGELQACITEEEMYARVQESYGSGFEEGQRQAERGLSNVFKALREAIEEVLALREQIFRDSEEDLLKLSILVAGKIVRQEISNDRRILAKVVAAALENSSERDEIVIRLNPEDHKLVTSHRQLYLNGIGDDKNLNLKADEAVSPGGCVVDTVTGEIDARLESQLEEIHKRLLEERGELIGFSPQLLKNREQHAYEES